MASELKIEVRCDRCRRLETRPVDEERKRIAEGGAAVAQFSATLIGATGKVHSVKIGDLCEPCERTVTNLLAGIEKKVDKKSPDRKAAKKS